MFTGIVEETGVIESRARTEDGLRLRIGADEVATGLEHGQSISVSGVCLTVERYEEGEWFEVFLATETVDRSYLGELEGGETVNLERAMPADGRFDGHVVQGHVDAVATVSNIESVEEDWFFEFELPPGYERYVVEKGSITLDGISLTVADLEGVASKTQRNGGSAERSSASSRTGEARETTSTPSPSPREDGETAEGGRVTVAIIPTTYNLTSLSEKEPGDPVHLEVDVLAKYVERLLEERFE
ncbi:MULTISPECIES: riboflavin synthase [Natrialbaceae]|uniref:riboflavin synthase n=1 Tax=Natrialbaceae TaxID=1644061 RepID=UPI00207D4DF6|nr:riboflavin synthase [Natronococcus sp. CG52]